MLIIPAIDIIDGQCVRLLRGDFALKTTYSNDPVKMAKKFEADGASMLHIVDLDGACDGKPQNSKIILKIRAAVQIPIQVGGGIRTLKDAKMYLNRGIDRLVIGTKAVIDESFIKNLLSKFGPGKIVVSLDIRNGKLAQNGWLETTDLDFRSFAERMKSLGITEVVVTDINRDGALGSPNCDTTRIVNDTGLNVIASGGVSDVASLKHLQKIGVKGAIIGKAIYENKITLEQAIKSVNICSNLTKRIIPCLDVANGRVVKGVKFKNLKDAGNSVELGKRYSDEGADELIFLDIMASKENRDTMIDLVKRVASEVFIPFTVGGGIKSVDEIRALLWAGADKISLNTAAIKNPSLISEAVRVFGSQCIVVAIDVKKKQNVYKVYVKGGSEETDLEAVSWAKKVTELGAGEILLTSMDRDGTRLGFDVDILRKISEAVPIPVIASGGAGSLEDLREALTDGAADAVLAASIFHYGKYSIKQAKEHLASLNIPVRL